VKPLPLKFGRSFVGMVFLLFQGVPKRSWAKTHFSDFFAIGLWFRNAKKIENYKTNWLSRDGWRVFVLNWLQDGTDPFRVMLANYRLSDGSVSTPSE